MKRRGRQYGEDDEVFFYEGSEVFVDKMTVDDFNKRLEEKLEYYLGVEVTQEDDHNLLLHQQGYIKKVLEHSR